MGEECQDGDAGLPLDCTPTPVPTPMPTPQPMRTSRKKGTQRRGCSAPARRCEAQRRGSNGAARDALPMDADTAARVTDAHDAERSTRCRVCSAPTRRCGWKRLARWRTTPRRPGRRLLLARRERGHARDLASFPKTSSTKGPFPSCAPRRRALCGVAGSGPSRTRRSSTNSAGASFAARGAAPPHDRSVAFFYAGHLDTAWHALPQKLYTRPDSAYAYRR